MYQEDVIPKTETHADKQKNIFSLGNSRTGRRRVQTRNKKQSRKEVNLHAAVMRWAAVNPINKTL